MDKMQEEFERWVSSKNLETSFGNYVDDEYDATWTQVYWEGWQASRKALVVELPTAWNASFTEKAIVMDASSVVEALEDAWISYK